MALRLPILLALVSVAAAGAAAAIDAEDFEVRTTQDLVDLCTTPPSDPKHVAAIHFCHGFMVGAYDYHALTRGEYNEHFFCVPSPRPTRKQAIEGFVAWARANPQHLESPAVDSEFRYLGEAWPCR